MCLAPCFKGCTDEAYVAEVQRVQAYLDSGGESLLNEISAERDRLSTGLEFEAAAQQHERLGKVKAVLSGADEICRRIDQLDAVIMQPSVEEKAVTLFRFRSGEFSPAQELAVDTEDQTEPLEARLRGVLEKLVPAGARSSLQFSEELALLKRWCYRGHRVGEIIFAREGGELPMRKLVNAIGRVHRGEKQVETTTQQQVPSEQPSCGPSRD